MNYVELLQKHLGLLRIMKLKLRWWKPQFKLRSQITVTECLIEVLIILCPPEHEILIKNAQWELRNG